MWLQILGWRKEKIVVICYWWSMVRVAECPPVITLFPLPACRRQSLYFYLIFYSSIFDQYSSASLPETITLLLSYIFSSTFYRYSSASLPETITFLLSNIFILNICPIFNRQPAGDNHFTFILYFLLNIWPIFKY